MKSENKIINKRSLIIVSVLLITMLMCAGCGNKEVAVKTYDKEKDAASQYVDETSKNKENNIKTEDEKSSVENKKEETTTKEQSSKASLSYDDLAFRGINFKSTLKDVENTFGIENSTREYVEDASGDTIIEVSYRDGLVVALNKKQDRVYWIKISQANLLQTSRGIKVGDTKKAILNAYPSDSIIKNEADFISVGFPGDKDDYSSAGRIVFNLEDNKIVSIVYCDTYAE